jgi:hypothetical protein
MEFRNSVDVTGVDIAAHIVEHVMATARGVASHTDIPIAVSA